MNSNGNKLNKRLLQYSTEMSSKPFSSDCMCKWKILEKNLRNMRNNIFQGNWSRTLLVITFLYFYLKKKITRNYVTVDPPLHGELIIIVQMFRYMMSVCIGHTLTFQIVFSEFVFVQKLWIFYACYHQFDTRRNLCYQIALISHDFCTLLFQL